MKAPFQGQTQCIRLDFPVDHCRRVPYRGKLVLHSIHPLAHRRDRDPLRFRVFYSEKIVVTYLFFSEKYSRATYRDKCSVGFIASTNSHIRSTRFIRSCEELESFNIVWLEILTSKTLTGVSGHFLPAFLSTSGLAITAYTKGGARGLPGGILKARKNRQKTNLYYVHHVLA